MSNVEMGDLINKGQAHFEAKKRPQYIAGLTAAIGAFALGTALGWTSPALPNIQERGDFPGFDTSSQLAAWIGSITPLGCSIAGIAAGLIVNRIGRKWTMIVMAPPLVAGWLIIAFATNTSMILAGRFITGLSGGAFTMVVPMYSSEIAEDSIRGILGNCLALFIVSGIFFSYVVGAFVSWKILCIICAVIPVIFAVGIFFLPESPKYLLAKGRDKEARAALKWLRGATHDEQVDPEFKQMMASIEEQNSQSATLRDLLKGPVLKPLFISLSLMWLQQFCGVNAVLFYTVDIFKSAGSDLDPNVAAIIVGGVQVAFAGVSLVIVERAGRKPLVIFSAIGMALSLVALGTFFYIQEHNPEGAKSLGWLPLTSLIIFIITYNLGLGPLPWTLMGELLPAHVKGLTSAIASAFCWGLAFIITKFFQDMLSSMTAAGCYWFFSACCILGAIFGFIWVPETKGKSMDEIQRLFSKT